MYGSCESLEEANYVFQKMHHPNVFTWNIMIKVYVQDGNLDGAYVLFEKMPQKDGVSWNTMMSAFVQNQQDMSAVYLFNRMLLECVLPDKISLLCILDACSKVEYVEQGLIIHVFIVNEGYDQNMAVSTALSNMHGKCANLRLAMIVFERMQQDTVSWNSMISGYAQSGCGSEALKLFMLWLHDNVKPDIVSVVGVVSACDHSGLVDDGCHFFTEMYESCTNSNSAQEHHICMIDMFGRVGRVDEAADYIEKMPCQPLANAWRALLGACRIHGDVTKAEEAARASLELEPENEVAHILLFNTYAAKEKIDPSI